MPDYKEFKTTPLAPLGIIATPGCEEYAARIDKYLKKWRADRVNDHKGALVAEGYERETFLIKADFPRFGSAEGKCHLRETVRGYDLFILCDPFNYSVTYEFYGMKNHMSPDDHFCDLKRAISAAAGKAKRISVIMPMLYEGRQHKRTGRESLDCADMLKELCEGMGVENIITFDAHDPKVQNAIPQKGFDSIKPIYQMIKAFCKNVDDIKLGDNLMIISPDEGAMGRCIDFAQNLGVEIGMFYKRRDYSNVKGGKNEVVDHRFLGPQDLSGKDVIVVDDMISSGGSMIKVAKELKERNANRIFVFSTFGLFCEGLDAFDKAYKDGIIDKIFTTNLIYSPAELLSREWYVSVDLTKYCSYIIDSINHNGSLSAMLDPQNKIKTLLLAKGLKQESDY